MKDRLEAMHIFIEVCALGGFAAAGRKLGLSRAQISKTIASLEAYLGVRLLNRTTRRLSLTEAGKLYLDRSPALLEEINDLETSLLTGRDKPSGLLRLAVPRTFGEQFLAPLLPKFLNRYPELNLDMNLTDRFVSIVEEGFDAAVRLGRLPNSSLVAKRLMRGRLCIYASPGYLQQRGEPKTRHDLIKHDCIADANFPRADHWPILEADQATALKIQSRITVNSALAAKSLAISGAGIACSPRLFVVDALTDGRLQEVLADIAAPWSDLFVVYPSKQYLPKKVRVFISWLTKSINDELPGE